MRRFFFIFLIFNFALTITITRDCQCQVVQEWLARYIGPGNGDFMNSMVIDNKGNVYVTGRSQDVNNVYDYATVKYNTAGVQQWVARYNWPNSTNSAEASSVAVDVKGNVYVTGIAPVSNSIRTSTVKYNTAGVQQWVAVFYGPFPQSSDLGSPSVAVDNTGNVYVAACVNWGLPTTYDYTIIKYDSSGAQQWFKTYSGPGSGINQIDQPCHLVLDNSDNVIVIGYSMGDTTYNDIATVKYNSSGILQWTARYNGPGNFGDSATALAVDNSGNVYVAGRSWGGPQTKYDYVTIKYNLSGVQLWTQTYNGFGNGNDVAKSIAVDSSGNVYVTGEANIGAGNVSYATIKYDSSGVQKWVALYNYQGGDFGRALALDRQGYVYVTGYSNEGVITHFATIKYSPTGTQEWCVRTSLGGESPVGIAVDSLNNVYVAGSDGHFLTIKYNQLSGITPISNEVPGEYKLYQNYPNPFNPSTKIKFSIPLSPLSERGAGGFMTLKIYDLLGREVATLVNQPLQPRTYEVTWDGTNYPSGVYFYRLTAGDYSNTKKLVILK